MVTRIETANDCCPWLRRLRIERGDTLVEFALAFMLFLATIFGTIEFGLAVWQYNMVSNFAQEGARWAAVRGATNASFCTGPGTVPCKATTADVSNFVNSRSLGMTVTVFTYSADAATKVCTTTATDPAVLVAGDGLCVKAQTTFAPFTRVVPMGTLTLQSTAQMIMAR
jgi:Flp pilus assembly protein TadG